MYEIFSTSSTQPAKRGIDPNFVDFTADVGIILSYVLYECYSECETYGMIR